MSKVTIGKNMTVPRGKEEKLREKPGGSNTGEYKNVSKSNFAGPKGGAPQGTYPINTEKRAKSALSYAHNAPNPQGIKNAVYNKYPSLDPRKK
jgi:hypothetical protein